MEKNEAKTTELDECPICYNEIELEDKVITQCGHVFDAMCILKALSNNTQPGFGNLPVRVYRQYLKLSEPLTSVHTAEQKSNCQNSSLPIRSLYHQDKIHLG